MGGVVGFIQDIIEPISKLIKEIGKALGIYSHDEILTDLRIVNLLTEGVADKSARRAAIRQSGGQMSEYGRIYQQFKRDYRKKYSANFLESAGYAPNTLASSRVLDGDEILEYIQILEPTATELIKYRGTYLDKYLTAKHYLQNNYDFTNHNETLIIGSKNYSQLTVSNGGATINIKMIRLYDETIVENLTNNYMYDGNSIYLPTGIKTISSSGTANTSTINVFVKILNSLDEIVFQETIDVSINKSWSSTSIELVDGEYNVIIKEDLVEVQNYIVTILEFEAYDVGVINSIIYSHEGVDSYKTICTKLVSPFNQVEIYTQVEYFTQSIYEYPYEVLYVEYKRSGYDSEYWFSYVENLDTIPSSLYELKTIPMTAIIPIKEDNVIVDLGEPRLKRMMRKLNIDPDSMLESLQNTDIDSTYIWTAIPFNTAGNAAAKTIYNSFDMLSVGSATVSISISKLSMSYNFTIDKSTSTGSVLEVGKYSKTLVGETLTLIYQGSNTEYKTIVITGYTHTYTVSGHSFSVTLSSSSEVSRMIVPLDVLNILSYREFVEVYEQSLSAIMYSMQVVHVKWYETGAFGVILKIVAAIVFVYTWWAGGASWSSALWTLAEMVLVGVIVNMIFKVFGAEVGGAIIILAILASAYTGNFGLALDSFKGYMSTASAILSTMNQAVSIKAQELAMKSKEELEEIANKEDSLKDKMDELRSLDSTSITMIMSFDDTCAFKTPNGVVDPDSYIYNMQGGTAFNWDIMYDVDGEISKRKVVNSG